MRVHGNVAQMNPPLSLRGAEGDAAIHLQEVDAVESAAILFVEAKMDCRGASLLAMTRRCYASNPSKIIWSANAFTRATSAGVRTVQANTGMP